MHGTTTRTASLLSAALLTATLGLTGCGGDEVAPKSGGRDQVTVGVIAIVDVAPIYLGKEKGFFSKRKIDLTLKPGSGGAASIPSVVKGEFQFAFGNVTSLLVARDQNLPLKVLTNGVASTGERGKDFSAVVVRGDSPIRTAADLAGKTVSVNNLRNIGDTTVRASVRMAGGDPASLKFIELALPEMPAAVQNKRVDAAWVVEPFLTQSIAQGARPIAWNFVDAAPKLTVATYFTSEKVIKQAPDLVKRFTEAMTESLAYAQAHPDEARKIVSTYTKIPPDVLAKVTLPAWPPEVNKESVQTLATLAKQDGLVKKEPDVDALLDEAK
jgi:NitT/TauT family transport system substrate-binding protein